MGAPIRPESDGPRSQPLQYLLKLDSIAVQRLRSATTRSWRAGCAGRRRDDKRCLLHRKVRPPNYATSRRAPGFRFATINNVRAAPDGARRPCSQSCSVRTETPSSAANLDWESPVFSRMLATSGRRTMRPASPRLNSRSPSRISRPILCFALAILHFLPNLSEYVRRNVLRDVLRVHRQHPDDAVRVLHVVDDALPTALPGPRRGPAQFSDATRPKDDRPRI